MEYEVKHNKDRNRFEVTIGDHLCEINYSTTPEGYLRVSHTGVPKALSGQGIAAAMTQYMLEYVKEKSLKIYPLCPYTRAYIERHPEYDDLVAKNW